MDWIKKGHISRSTKVASVEKKLEETWLRWFREGEENHIPDKESGGKVEGLRG